MPTVVLLRDEFEIDSALGSVTVLHLESHVREDEVIAIDVKPLSPGDGKASVSIGLTL